MQFACFPVTAVASLTIDGQTVLDLGNAGAVLNAVLTGSGLKPGIAPVGEAAAPGASPGAASVTSNSVCESASPRTTTG